jgi:hypothetical protein
MRIVRSRYYAQRDERDNDLEGASVVVGAVLFNRFETGLIRAALWVREVWFETFTCRAGRVLCRGFRRHNVTCRGRRDHHVPGVGLVDPGRWHYRPRG